MSDDPRVMLVSREYIINRGRILAVQRAATVRNNPFLYEVPGGKLERDQELIDTLGREIDEETGLVTRPIDTLVHYESDALIGGRYDGVLRVTLFGVSHMVGGTLRLSAEHDEFRWCSYAQFMRLDLTPTTRRAAAALEHRLRKAGVR